MCTQVLNDAYTVVVRQVATAGICTAPPPTVSGAAHVSRTGLPVTPSVRPWKRLVVRWIAGASPV